MEKNMSFDINNKNLNLTETILPDGNEPLGSDSSVKKKRNILQSIRKRIGLAFESLNKESHGDNFEKSISFESLSTGSFLKNNMCEDSSLNKKVLIQNGESNGDYLFNNSATCSNILPFQDHSADLLNTGDNLASNILNPPIEGNLKHNNERSLKMGSPLPSSESSPKSILNSFCVDNSGVSFTEESFCAKERVDHWDEQEKEKEALILAREIEALKVQGWYWGAITRNDAEQKLYGQPDGTFLLRDSSDSKHLLSLSFKSFGKTLHTRIEQNNGKFSFHPQPDHSEHTSLVSLIDHCISRSYSGVFCYSRPLTKGAPSFPVRLTQPLSKFNDNI